MRGEREKKMAKLMAWGFDVVIEARGFSDIHTSRFCFREDVCGRWEARRG